METEKEGCSEKTTSVGTATAAASDQTESNHANTIRPTWNVMSVRGKVTDKCLWSACKAMTAGILLIVVGAGMATLGFYSDHLSTVEETKGNTTVWVKNESKDSHLGSLTYLGPVVMGVGGFTIVAACVMTFEARDTAAKIVPIWFRRTRIHVVSGGSGSTPSGRSSKTSWERFLAQQRMSEDGGDSRSAITQALVNFSKYLQSSVDTNKMTPRSPAMINRQGSMHKCPSEPNLMKTQRDKAGDNNAESVGLLESSTPQPTQRTTYGGGLKTMTGATRPQLLSVTPDAYRQAVSMDCPRPPRLQRQEAQDNQNVETAPSVSLPTTEGTRIQALALQASCTTSSSGSMSVDIYLPQGAVTLRVHDDMKDTSKRSSLLPKDPKGSREVRFSQQSDIQSFDDDFMYPEADDSVFLNQDSYISTPQIILDTLDTESPKQVFPSDSYDNLSPPVSYREQTSVEDWVTCSATIPSMQTSVESLEMNSSHESPGTTSSVAQFSFEYSELDSTGISITSVISNPHSSNIWAQRSLSQTDTSFMNVSSLNSMGSSQELCSPMLFSGSPRDLQKSQHFFSNTGDTTSTNPETHKSIEYTEYVPQPYTDLSRTFEISKANVTAEDEFLQKKRISAGLSHESVDLGAITLLDMPALKDNNPRKHRSLESAEVLIAKERPQISDSPKHTQLSLDISDTRHVSDLNSSTSARYLSPHFTSTTTTLSPRTLTFSPRKVRSESLPERRTHSQAPSLKRFPLLRQGALDAFAEESGSTPRLDTGSRSQTQTSPTYNAFPPSA